ncbi:MAG: tetratricopeptide repeat protein [Gemmatimonadota bacterium]
MSATSQRSLVQQEIRRFAADHARHPESRAFARLADAYRKAGRGEKALALLEEGLERHPRYVAAHSVRARTLRDLGRPAEAADAFRAVLEIDPGNLVALKALAEIAEGMGNTEEAEAWYGRLREAEFPGGGGESRAEGGPHGEEAENGSASLEAEGSGGDDELVVTSTMADLLLRQELYEEAVQVCERLLRSRPGDPELLAKLDAAKRLSAGRRPGQRRRRHPEPLAGTPPDGTDRGEGISVREYLNRLLEGRADPSSAGRTRASRFRSWLKATQRAAE